MGGKKNSVIKSHQRMEEVDGIPIATCYRYMNYIKESKTQQNNE